jgi:STE24 endopeptidase
MTPDIAFYGDASKHLSAPDTGRAIYYYKWGYEFRALSFINYALYLFLSVKFLLAREENDNSAASATAPAADIVRFCTGAALACLPYRFVLGYLKEKHFGFFNPGPAGWFTLYFKQFLISLIVIIFIFTFIRFIVSRFYNKWHFALALSVPAAGLILSILAQSILLPVFYKTTELSDAALAGRLTSIAAASGVNAEKINIIDESRYSNRANAFFTGFGPWRNIYLCDTLLSVHNRDEIEAIYAHELGHYIYNHELYGIMAASIAAAFIIFLLKFSADKLNIGAGELSGLIGRRGVIALILFQAAYFFAMPVENYISRCFERAADSFAIEAAINFNGAQNAEKAIEAHKNLFIKLAGRNLSNPAPDRFNYLFFATHPAVIERIHSASIYYK